MGHHLIVTITLALLPHFAIGATGKSKPPPQFFKPVGSPNFFSCDAGSSQIHPAGARGRSKTSFEISLRCQISKDSAGKNLLQEGKDFAFTMKCESDKNGPNREFTDHFIDSGFAIDQLNNPLPSKAITTYSSGLTYRSLLGLKNLPKDISVEQYNEVVNFKISENKAIADCWKMNAQLTPEDKTDSDALQEATGKGGAN